MNGKDEVLNRSMTSPRMPPDQPVLFNIPRLHLFEVNDEPW